MFEVLLLIFGLIGLWMGTELTLKGALTIAHTLQLSHLFVGLGVLAIGTDLPELVVSINAAIEMLAGVDTSGVIVGNAVGSSIANITLVMGIAGLIGYLQLPRAELRHHSIWLTIGLVLLLLLGADGEITPLDGGFMIAAYGVYYYTLLDREKRPSTHQKLITRGIASSVVQLCLGLGVLIIASEMVVNNAVLLAGQWGVKQSLIALLIIGPGTSLPEIAVSVGAIFRKAPAMSVGNIIGSNVFNALIPIGAAALLHPVAMETGILMFDIPVLLVITATAMLFFRRKKGLQRPELAVLLGAYFIYCMVKILAI